MAPPSRAGDATNRGSGSCARLSTTGRKWTRVSPDRDGAEAVAAYFHPDVARCDYRGPCGVVSGRPVASPCDYPHPAVPASIPHGPRLLAGRASAWCLAQSIARLHGGRVGNIEPAATGGPAPASLQRQRLQKCNFGVMLVSV